MSKAQAAIPAVLQAILLGEPRWERRRRHAKLRAEIERLRDEGKLEQALDECVGDSTERREPRAGSEAQATKTTRRGKRQGNARATRAVER